jgi:L-2-amino-thiazoline-4-carboxylic acid hydrolase
MTQKDDTVEKLRNDLFMALANRALIYTAILKELRAELGEEKASGVLHRALYSHGMNMAHLLQYPKDLNGFRDWLLGFLPDGGAMHQPEVVSCDEKEFVVRLHRCPLKEAWRMAGLSREEVEDMCAHADRFDHGFFGSVFDYTMDSWSKQPDDACVLTFRRRET